MRYLLDDHSRMANEFGDMLNPERNDRRQLLQVSGDAQTVPTNADLTKALYESSAVVRTEARETMEALEHRWEVRDRATQKQVADAQKLTNAGIENLRVFMGELHSSPTRAFSRSLAWPVLRLTPIPADISTSHLPRSTLIPLPPPLPLPLPVGASRAEPQTPTPAGPVELTPLEIEDAELEAQGLPTSHTLAPIAIPKAKEWKTAINQWTQRDPAAGLDWPLGVWRESWYVHDKTLYSNYGARRTLQTAYEAAGSDDAVFFARYGGRGKSVGKVLLEVRRLLGGEGVIKSRIGKVMRRTMLAEAAAAAALAAVGA
ncbi:hypothetical protein P7C70_g7172, partial [Phenoliferia sp. Uapishka_3]